MKIEPEKESHRLDILALKFKPTSELLAELRELSQMPKDQTKADLIVDELQFRGLNNDAAALIASIDQQRRQIARETAEMTKLLNQRESRNSDKGASHK